MCAFSAEEGKGFFKDWLVHVAQPLGFKRFLDVGAGAGRYGEIIREVFGIHGVQVDAVEIFTEYINRHNLHRIYDGISTQDIRHLGGSLGEYDLIICGDVLEHMTKSEAIEVVSMLKPMCKFLWVMLPMKIDRSWSAGYAQPEDDFKENPYNKHYHDWTWDEIQDSFKPLFVVPYIITGTFLVEGGL